MRSTERRDEDMYPTFEFQLARILSLINKIQKGGLSPISVKILQKTAFSRFRDLEDCGKVDRAYEVINTYALPNNPLRKLLPPEKLG